MGRVRDLALYSSLNPLCPFRVAFIYNLVLFSRGPLLIGWLYFDALVLFHPLLQQRDPILHVSLEVVKTTPVCPG